jgi:gas vesicle protein
MTSSTQLERETEQTRSQLADTLEELRARITPGQVMDQVVDYARDSGAGDFFRNLARDVTNNPVPVTLIGAGIAWLMFSNQRQRSGGLGLQDKAGELGTRARSYVSEAVARTRAATETAKDAASQMADRARDYVSDTMSVGQDAAQRAGSTVSELASRVSGRSPTIAEQMGDYYAQTTGTAGERGSSAARQARETAGATVTDISGRARSAAANLGSAAGEASARISDSMGSAASTIKDTASSAYGMASEGAGRAGSAFRDTASSLRRVTGEQGRNLLDFCRDQPLVLGGIGLAIGAVLGAAFPATATENQLMGDTSDEMKDRAQKLAAGEYEKAKDFAGEQYEKAKSAAQETVGEGLARVLNEAEDRGLVPKAEEHDATLVPPHPDDQKPSATEQATDKSHGSH